MIHDKSYVFPSQALTTQEHPALSSLLKRGQRPKFLTMDKKTAVNLSLFLSATFSRWKHLLSTFTVNDRSITRSSFEINVLIPRWDAMTSDAVIDRRISDTQSQTNTDSWHVVTGQITDMLCVTLSVLTRVPCGVTYKHRICPSSSFRDFFACSWFLLLSWPTDRNAHYAQLVLLISLIFWAEAFKHFNDLFKGGYRVR